MRRKTYLSGSINGLPYWMITPWMVLRFACAFGFPLILSLISIWISRQLDIQGLEIRYILVPLLIGVWIFWRSAAFLKQAFGLNGILDGLARLINVFFTPTFPEVHVQMGEMVGQSLVDQLLRLIGGPATLSISPENAVLIEAMDGKLRILGHGKHRVYPHERLKQVIDLKEREGWVTSRSATSLDGIPIEIKDVRYRIRPYRGVVVAEAERISPTVFSFKEEAIMHMVYNCAFNETGQANWEKAVEGTILSVITRYVAQHLAMELIAPHLYNLDPRAEIYQQLFSPSIQQRLFKLGVELTWMDIGHFGWPEVLRQGSGSWSSQWVKDLKVLQGYDRSQRTLYEDVGRREAQAEIIISLVHALQQEFQETGDQAQVRERMFQRARQVIENLRSELVRPRNST